MVNDEVHGFLLGKIGKIPVEIWRKANWATEKGLLGFLFLHSIRK